MSDIEHFFKDIKDNRETGNSDLRQAQLVELKILKQFHNICQKHGLKYWLDGGTLLGAVRHGGFIPWDDDIDVAMPIKDYKKFIRLPKSEIPDDIFLKTSRTDTKAVNNVTKLMDKYSTFYDGSSPIYTESHNGIFIDIFPFIQYPKLNNEILFYLVSRARWRILFTIREHKITWYNIVCYYKILIESKILILIFNLLKFPSSNLGNKLEENVYDIIHSLESIYPLKKIKFEDGYFWGTNDPHKYLTDLYGNYMQMPPENKRRTHAILIKPFEKCNHSETLDWNMG
jgi:lipopolysaccharide cholinephosphotransferase